jgi:hypothetical protein
MYLKQYMYIFFILQELLTKHKMLSSEFLENNYDKIFDNYQMLYVIMLKLCPTMAAIFEF